MPESLLADKAEDGGFTTMLTPSQDLAASLNPALLDTCPPRSHESDRRLTIHRRTTTHHGTSLKLLGHAAEYLTDSIAGPDDNSNDASVREAVHLLMRSSREVFDDYATANSRRHTIADWIMRGAVRVYGRAS